MIKRKSRAFTLAELTVIICSVSVIAAMLYPVLEKYNEDSRKSACIANLHWCSIALLAYMGDYDSGLPSSVLAATPRGSTPTQAQVIQYLTGADVSSVPGAPQSTTWIGTMHGYVKDPNCVFCPSDTPRTRLSYWYRYALDLAWRDPSILARKEYQYAYPAAQIIFYEHAGWHTGDAAGIKNGVTVNVVYLDAHTSTVTVTNGPAAYPTAADEASGASAIRLGSPMYYNYDNDTTTQHSGVADWIDPRRYSDHF